MMEQVITKSRAFELAKLITPAAPAMATSSSSWALAAPETQEAIVAKYTMIPAHFADGVTLADMMTIFTSMFMHGDWWHLIGNMLFLWVFADNIEATVGHVKFLLFYAIGGLAAGSFYIPFKGGGAVATQLVGGHVDLTFAQIAAIYPLYKDRRAKLLATATHQRLEFLPEIPTLAELGVRGGYLAHVEPAADL